MKQSFIVYVRVEADLDNGLRPYSLSEAKVKQQIGRFLKGRNITEGIACHGTSDIRVTDCIETKPK